MPVKVYKLGANIHVEFILPNSQSSSGHHRWPSAFGRYAFATDAQGQATVTLIDSQSINNFKTFLVSELEDQAGIPRGGTVAQADAYLTEFFGLFFLLGSGPGGGSATIFYVPSTVQGDTQQTFNDGDTAIPASSYARLRNTNNVTIKTGTPVYSRVGAQVILTIIADNTIVRNSAGDQVDDVLHGDEGLAPDAEIVDGSGNHIAWVKSNGQYICLAMNETPLIDAIANQTNDVGDTVSLQVIASDPDGDVLTYQATGLPAGLTISPTGLISGTLTTEQALTTEVNVQDLHGGTHTITFTWTVNAVVVAALTANNITVTPLKGALPSLTAGDMITLDYDVDNDFAEILDFDASEVIWKRNGIEVHRFPNYGISNLDAGTNTITWELQLVDQAGNLSPVYTGTVAATIVSDPAKARHPYEDQQTYEFYLAPSDDNPRAVVYFDNDVTPYAWHIGDVFGRQRWLGSLSGKMPIDQGTHYNGDSGSRQMNFITEIPFAAAEMNSSMIRRAVTTMNLKTGIGSCTITHQNNSGGRLRCSTYSPTDTANGSAPVNTWAVVDMLQNNSGISQGAAVKSAVRIEGPAGTFGSVTSTLADRFSWTITSATIGLDKITANTQSLGFNESDVALLYISSVEPLVADRLATRAYLLSTLPALP